MLLLHKCFVALSAFIISSFSLHLIEICPRLVAYGNGLRWWNFTLYRTHKEKGYMLCFLGLQWHWYSIKLNVLTLITCFPLISSCDGVCGVRKYPLSKTYWGPARKVCDLHPRTSTKQLQESLTRKQLHCSRKKKPPKPKQPTTKH